MRYIFLCDLDEFQNELYSLWNIEAYPEGDYLNFQIWGGSIPQAVHIANTIIDQLAIEKSLGKTFIPNNIPEIFIQKGFYRDGQLTLSIVNKAQANQINFRGNKRATEQDNEELITKSIPLSGSYFETITIDTGYLFDIGFAITGDDPTKADILYLADGPWGVDYQEGGATISDFSIAQNKASEQDTDDYLVERDVTVQGSVKETMNLFRNILGGDLTLRYFRIYVGVTFELQVK